jgi:hypothetical protein
MKLEILNKMYSIPLNKFPNKELFVQYWLYLKEVRLA